MDSGSDLEIKYEGAPNEPGVVTISVIVAGDPIHVSRVKILDATDRERFVTELAARIPNLDIGEVGTLLLKIASAVASGDARAKPTPPPPSCSPGVEIPEKLANRPRGPRGAPGGSFQKGDAVYCLDRGNWGHIGRIDEDACQVGVKHKSPEGHIGSSLLPFDMVIFAGGRSRSEAIDIGKPGSKAQRSAVGPKRTPPPWKPFPVELLPEPLKTFVIEQSAALNIDPAYVASTVLPALAAAIGGSRRIRIKSGWDHPATLWGLLVVDSGGHKSPTIRAATRWNRQEESRERMEFNARYAEYKKKKEEISTQKKAKQRASSQNKNTTDTSTSGFDTYTSPLRDVLAELADLDPERPTCVRRVVEDSTIEALAIILSVNPRGVLCVRDEASGWFDGFNEYKRKGGDTARWNALYEGGVLSVDRKGGEIPSLHVENACVSVLGGIQPKLLANRMSEEATASGLLPRFYLVQPPRTPKRWTDAVLSQLTSSRMAAIFRALFDLPMGIDDHQKPCPTFVDLDADALAVWIDFVNRRGEDTASLVDADAAWAAKFEGVAARVALVITLVRDPSAREVTGDDMTRAVAIQEWLAYETDRVRALLTRDDLDREREALIGVIRRNGGSMTPRKLIALCRKFKDASPSPTAAARAALADLAEAGLGRIEEQPSNNGKGTRMHFHLVDPVSMSAAFEDDDAEGEPDLAQSNAEYNDTTVGNVDNAAFEAADKLLTDVSSFFGAAGSQESASAAGSRPSGPCAVCGSRSFWSAAREPQRWECAHCHPANEAEDTTVERFEFDPDDDIDGAEAGAIS